ncbi:MAG: DNA polymerase III subunit gamma/tau [Solirubrobacterales bacterium]
MSAAASLYRRHRPRTFDDVIGQEHVVRTLRNAVDGDNVHHAYMFVGSRGTGKTSMAKILASALNCADGPKSVFAADDPAVVSIAAGTSMDVVEMDAASNNGVDDIRDLIDSVSVMPVGGGWKVYILDEAHMITPQGWNAFLKTLEEPPPRTVFVLATTEANKVLPTVADRCHRFDFRRPTVEQLATAVRRAADAEGIEIGDDAVAMIGRAATGSFRDALGTLEQLVTYGGKKVDSDDVQAVLGVADFELLLRTADALVAGDRRAVLKAVAELADSGRDMVAFARDFAGHIRNLLVTRTLDEAPTALGLTAEQSARLVEQAAGFGPERSTHTLDLLSLMITAARGGADPRLQLELALFKAARPEDDTAPDALLARIEALEQRPSQPLSSAPAPSPTAPAPSISVEDEAAALADQPESVTVTAVATAEPENPDGPESADEPPPPPVEDLDNVTDLSPSAEIGDEPAGIHPPSLETVVAAWPEVVAAVQEASPRIGVVVDTARPHAVDGRKLILAFPQSSGFLRKTADQAASKTTIAGHVADAVGFSFLIANEQIPDSEFNDGIEPAPANVGIDGEALVEQLKKEFDATEMAESD